ncbi:hypothetical protein Rs2_46379 [Raphanus sativus]|nr:hypothetical protein Rs2_46379 [Raphanus sativus]
MMTNRSRCGNPPVSIPHFRHKRRRPRSNGATRRPTNNLLLSTVLRAYFGGPVHILKKSMPKSKRKRITRRYEPEGSSARSVKETKVTPIAKAKRVPWVALDVPEAFRKRK